MQQLHIAYVGNNLKMHFSKPIFFLIVIFCSCSYLEREQKEVLNSVDVDKQEKWINLVNKGEEIFETQCKSCHKSLPIGMCKSWGDPFYMGEETFFKFVLSSTELRDSGDLWAIELKSEFEDAIDFEHEFGNELSQQEITELMVFIKNISETK